MRIFTLLNQSRQLRALWTPAFHILMEVLKHTSMSMISWLLQWISITSWGCLQQWLKQFLQCVINWISKSTSVRSLSKKWEVLVVGLFQTVLGLTVDTNRLTVGITPEYQDQVRHFLVSYWPISWQIFKVANIQKLVGKLAQLGEGAPWIYKIILHIYTSLAYALKQNTELLLACSPNVFDIVGNIKWKHFFGNSKIAAELNFALKTAARMVNHHKQVYFINETIRAEI